MSFNFFPCLIFLKPQLKVVGTAEYRGFNCYEKVILRVSAVTKSFWLRVSWPTRPHVVILVPAKCSGPTTLFLCWCDSTDAATDSVAMLLLEMPGNVPVVQVKELFRRALALILITLLFGLILISWCIPSIDHNRALTCQVHHSTHMLQMVEKVIILIFIEKLCDSERKWQFPPLFHLPDGF